MGRYVPNMVVRNGEISRLQLIKAQKNPLAQSAERMNTSLNRIDHQNMGLYFAVACGNCWHIFERTQGRHPKLRLTKLPQASAEMWLRHRSIAP